MTVILAMVSRISSFDTAIGFSKFLL